MDVADAGGGGYYRLQLKLTLAVWGTVAGRRLGALEGGVGGGGGYTPPFQFIPAWGHRLLVTVSSGRETLLGVAGDYS